MTRVVYLIRHGEVQAKVNEKGERLVYGPSVHLSAEGIEQIKSLGTLLIDQTADITRFYTSPYQRAKETTQILHTFFPNADIIEVEELKDSIINGAIGLPLDYADRGLQFRKLPGDESLKQTAHRVWESFNAILAKENQKTIAFISHGHPIRIIKALLTEGLTIEDLSKMTAQEFQSKNYLSKAEAWKFTLISNGVIVSQFISTQAGRSPDQKREN